MLIKEKIGNLAMFAVKGRSIDYLPLEWYECNKRILHKKTNNGREVSIKFLKEPQCLQQDDVLYTNDEFIIAVEIIPCEVMVIRPASMYEMAYVCYEIGNKHLPLFYEHDELLMPYDAPTYRMLQAAGFTPELKTKKLQNQLKTSVAAHAHTGGESLFSRIMKLTTSAND